MFLKTFLKQKKKTLTLYTHGLGLSYKQKRSSPYTLLFLLFKKIVYAITLKKTIIELVQNATS